jgi:hypothetical protein
MREDGEKMREEERRIMKKMNGGRMRGEWGTNGVYREDEGIAYTQC